MEGYSGISIINISNISNESYKICKFCEEKWIIPNVDDEWLNYDLYCKSCENYMLMQSFENGGTMTPNCLSHVLCKMEIDWHGENPDCRDIEFGEIFCPNYSEDSPYLPGLYLCHCYPCYHETVTLSKERLKTLQSIDITDFLDKCNNWLRIWVLDFNNFWGVDILSFWPKCLERVTSAHSEALTIKPSKRVKAKMLTHK